MNEISHATGVISLPAIHKPTPYDYHAQPPRSPLLPRSAIIVPASNPPTIDHPAQFDGTNLTITTVADNVISLLNLIKKLGKILVFAV